MMKQPLLGFMNLLNRMQDYLMRTVFLIHLKFISHVRSNLFATVSLKHFNNVIVLTMFLQCPP